MGWEDRQYAKQDDYRHAVGPRFRGSGMSRYDVVTKIIIANILVHLFSRGPLNEFLATWFLMQGSAVAQGQVWRLFTATYLHADFGHIFWNLFALYVFGPLLEDHWGSRRFFMVYTLGGIFGNLVLFAASALGFIGWHTFGLGASGSVMTVMGALAVLFPNTEVLIYFVFPLRIRDLVIIYALAYAYNVSRMGANYGGDLCHLGGLVVGWWWARTGGIGWTNRLFLGEGSGGGSLFGRRAGRPGGFRQRVAQNREDAAVVDQLLAKVSEGGLHSLSEKEKATLKAASDRLKTNVTG